MDDRLIEALREPYTQTQSRRPNLERQAADEIEALGAKLRMIISHATGGATSDISLPTNEIAVHITQKVNRVWEAAHAHAYEEAAKAAGQFADWKRKNPSDQNVHLVTATDIAAAIRAMGLAPDRAETRNGAQGEARRPGDARSAAGAQTPSHPSPKD